MSGSSSSSSACCPSRDLSLARARLAKNSSQSAVVPDEVGPATTAMSIVSLIRAGSVAVVMREQGPRALWGEATALFIAGFGAAGYATWRDLTAVARASFWVGRTAVTDQGPAGVVHGRDRVAPGTTVDCSST